VKSYNNWEKDLSYSMKALLSIEKTILPTMISGKIHSIENSDNHVLVLMDRRSGIDYIRENEHGLQGIAARVQWGNAWDTFTIREKRHTGTITEMQKRIFQIENGYFYPYFTLQAYFSDRKEMKFLSAAAVKTVDLYDFIKEKPFCIYRNKSDNDFLFIKFSDLQNNGIKIVWRQC